MSISHEEEIALIEAVQRYQTTFGVAPDLLSIPDRLQPIPTHYNGIEVRVQRMIKDRVFAHDDIFYRIIAVDVQSPQLEPSTSGIFWFNMEPVTNPKDLHSCIMKTYTGLTETFEYCTICDKRK